MTTWRHAASLSLCLLAGVAEAGGARRFALVVGSNDGGAERVRLRYAVSDAEAVATVLHDVGGVAPGDLLLLREPGAQAITGAFDTLSERIIAARAGADRVEVVVYYSGHADEAGMLPGGQPYAWGRLRTELARLDADVRVAILDACASGASVRGKGGTFRPPFLDDDAVTVHGSAWLASSAADEASQESDRIGGSYFTHHLVTALRGAADADADAVVTVNEAYAYTWRRTRQSTELSRLGTQTPTFDLDLSGGGDVVLSDLRVASARLRVDAGVAGELWLQHADGTRLQVDKAPGRELDLSLPPGVWRVTVQARPAAYTGAVDVRPGETTLLSPVDLRPASLDAAATARGDGRPPVRVDAQGVGRPEGPLATRDVQGVALHVLGGVHHDLRGASLSLFGTRSRAGVDGAQLALGYAAVDGDLRGAQLAAGVDVVGGSARGLQSAWLATVIRGRSASASHAVQLAGLAAIADGPLKGAQLAGLVDVATGHVSGAQLAGLVNVAGGGVVGAQLAGLGNTARGGVRGLQAAGVFNSALGLRGAQLGLVNHVDHGAGVQAGLVNVARDLRGVQVGLVNIADRVHGESIGLLTLARNGYHAVELWSDDLTPVAAGFKFGSHHLYSTLLVGLDPTDGARWTVGGGLGVHAPFFDRRMFVDSDVTVRLAELAAGADGVDGLVGSWRLSLGGDVAGPFGLFLGPAVHGVWAWRDALPPQSLLPGIAVADRVTLHVGYQAGVRVRF